MQKTPAKPGKAKRICLDTTQKRHSQEMGYMRGLLKDGQVFLKGFKGLLGGLCVDVPCSIYIYSHIILSIRL